MNSGLLQAEVGNTGGWAAALSGAIGMMLYRKQVDGISVHAHVHVAYRGGIQHWANDWTHGFGSASEEKIRMPKVARSFLELVHMAQAKGLDATSSIA